MPDLLLKNVSSASHFYKISLKTLLKPCMNFIYTLLSSVETIFNNYCKKNLKDDA